MSQRAKTKTEQPPKRAPRPNADLDKQHCGGIHPRFYVRGGRKEK